MLVSEAFGDGRMIFPERGSAIGAPWRHLHGHYCFTSVPLPMVFITLDRATDVEVNQESSKTANRQRKCNSAARTN